jgi:hypothetical protein
MAETRDKHSTAPELATRPERTAVPVDRDDLRDYEDEPTSETITAVLGSASRRGEWEPADCTRVFAVLGNAELDFRNALLVPGVTEVEVYTFCGSARIVVPEGLEVELTGNALLGGFNQSTRVSKARRLLRRTLRAARGDVDYDEEADLEPDEDPPLLRVSGLAFLGNVNVVTR